MSTRIGWLAILGALALLGCEGTTGGAGPSGARGDDGTDGTEGTDGEDGRAGADGKDGADGTDGNPANPGGGTYLTDPGLHVELLDFDIADGTATVQFRLTDESGTPLDREGLRSEGEVDLSFVLAWLDEQGGEPLDYTPLTTRIQTSPITLDSAVQPAADDGGTYTVLDLEDGVYAYEFATNITVTNPDKTHTLAMYASRDFDGDRYVSNEWLHFRPDGQPVVTTREIVETDTCNNCHNPLAVHGGRRRAVELCVTCHATDAVDPDTGNSIKMSNMIHRLHRGHDLPTVVAGTPYEIIGFQQSVHDYSTVVFPQPVQNCVTCHTGKDGDLWKTRPGRDACRGCHDDLALVTPPPPGMLDHVGGAQPDDSICHVCHSPTGGNFSIEDRHWTDFSNPSSPEIVFSIISLENTGPGQVPEMVFTATQDGVPLDILTTPLDRIRVTMAGPTTDYAGYAEYTIQGGGASGTLTADPNGFRYTFPAAMDVGATGTYGFGMEGRVNVGGTNYNAKNPVAYAPVTDAVAVPRREIVDTAKCNSCHDELSLHGGAKRDAEYCVMCHNANNVGDERISRLEGSVVTAESVDFRVFIHKIHSGEQLSQQPYILGGFPPPDIVNPLGNPIDFGEVRFPGDRRDCETCHVAGSYELPINAPNRLPTHVNELTCNELPAADGDDYCDDRSVTQDIVTGPTASACLGCHDSPDQWVHAALNTLATGEEACSACHGPGDAYDAALGHRLDP